MLKHSRRWLATPAGVITVGLLAVAWTWLTLGWEAAWRLLAVLVALGIADIALGAWSKPLSLEVYWSWRRSRRRYLMWWAGMGVGLLLLHLHFTGV